MIIWLGDAPPRPDTRRLPTPIAYQSEGVIEIPAGTGSALSSWKRTDLEKQAENVGIKGHPKMTKKDLIMTSIITSPVVRAALAGSAAGAAATFAKTKAEGFLQPRAEKLLPPSPAAKTALGGDGSGHPENMPPSEVADRAQHTITGKELTDEQRLKAAAPLHWGMGVGFGIAYAVATTWTPAVRAGRGTGAGAALFVAAHGIGLPAAHLQHPPTQLPRAWWIWEAGSHLVYGAVLDASLGLVQRLAFLRSH